MIKIKNNCYRGTRILLGDKKRERMDECIKILRAEGFQEISMPIIQLREIFKDKVGEENNNMMYSLTDRGNRDLCLAPEYTAIIQKLALDRFKYEKDLKLFYVQECFRGERPQAGRFRQFTQLGVEIINPDKYGGLVDLASKLIEVFTDKYKVDENVKRGLDYYKDGKGFEITCDELGSSKQVCGGGEYEGGTGFAIGVDRLLG